MLFRVLIEFEHPLLFKKQEKKNLKRTRRDAQKRKKEKKEREREPETCARSSDEKMKEERNDKN